MEVSWQLIVLLMRSLVLSCDLFLGAENYKCQGMRPGRHRGFLTEMASLSPHIVTVVSADFATRLHKIALTLFQRTYNLARLAPTGGGVNQCLSCLSHIWSVITECYRVALPHVFLYRVDQIGGRPAVKNLRARPYIPQLSRLLLVRMRSFLRLVPRSVAQP
jgi:hypothetical protein